MFIRVAKRNSEITTRKQRDYPWKNLAEFLNDDQTPDGTLVGMNSSVVDDIVQTRFRELFSGAMPEDTIIRDRVPNDGFYQGYVVKVDEFLKLYDSSEDFYNKTIVQYRMQKYEFFGSEEYIARKHNCLVVDMNIPGFELGFTFMLRPFIFDQQKTDDLWHAGSMLVHTKTNPRGWFYQLKFQIDR